MRWNGGRRWREGLLLRSLPLPLHPRTPPHCMGPHRLRPPILRASVRLVSYRVPAALADPRATLGAGDCGDYALISRITRHATGTDTDRAGGSVWQPGRACATRALRGNEAGGLLPRKGKAGMLVFPRSILRLQ